MTSKQELEYTKVFPELFEPVTKYAEALTREGEPLHTEAIAEVRVIREYLHLVVDMLSQNEKQGVVRATHLLAEALERVPELDQTLWPLVEQMYRKHFNEEIPTRGLIPKENTKRSLSSLFPEANERNAIERSPVIGGLARLRHTPIFRAALFVLALQGMLREERAHAQTPERNQTAHVHTAFDDALTETVYEKTPNVQEEFFDTISGATAFTKEQLRNDLGAHITEHPEQWGISSEEALEDSIERATNRVWQFLSLVSGESNDSMHLHDRTVRAKMSREEDSHEVLFSVSEQQEYIRTWLRLNAKRLTALDSSISNRTVFTENQAAHMAPFIAYVDGIMPFGIVVFTSGERNQTDTIWNVARARGIDLMGLEKENETDVRNVHGQLVRMGVKINLPGHSKHEQGLAIDVAGETEDFPKLFESIATQIKEEIKKTGKGVGLIVERENGAHGVLHIELTEARKDMLASMDM